MKKVIVFGTFDEINDGHRHMLKEAKEYGDYLIVVVALDTTICALTNKKPKNNQEKRLAGVQALGLADKVRLGCLDDRYRAIREEQPDIVALGFDQKIFVDKLAENIPESSRIVRLSPHQPELFRR